MLINEGFQDGSDLLLLAAREARGSVFDGTGQRVATMNGTDIINISVYDAASHLVAEYGQASSGSGTQYVFSDHQGTPRVVTTSTRTVQGDHDSSTSIRRWPAY